jgi:hypothetical protein
VPTVSEFNGIKIAVYTEFGIRHHEPHFHAYYGNSKAVFSIVTLEILVSTRNFPAKTAAEIKEWAMKHRSQLKKNWYRAKYQKPIIEM